MKHQMIKFISLLLLAAILVAGIPVRDVQAAVEKPYLIKINRQACVITIYEKDAKGQYTVPVKAMLCSPSDYTPLGTFQTPAKYRWRLLIGDVWGQYSTRITGSILIHSVWYYEKDPSTLSNRQFNRLGTRCSLGCIRVNVADSKWIYDNCPLGTTVVVYDSPDPGPLGKPEAIKVSEKTLMGYDPTDIWSEGNPYVKKPTLRGVKDRTVNYGKSVDLKKGVKAESFDGKDLTSKIQITITYQNKTVKKVDTKKTGDYQITYRVADGQGYPAEEKAVCTVVDNVAPKLSGVKKLYLNQKPDRDSVLADVRAKWHGKNMKKEDISAKWKKTDSSNGVTKYTVTYSYKAANGKSVKATTKAYYDKKAPVFSGVTGGVIRSAEELTEEFLRADVTVSDNLDKLTIDDVSVIQEEIEENYYEVVYRVSDRAGNEAEARAYYTVESEVVFQGVEDRTVPPEQVVDEAFAREGVTVWENDVEATERMTVEITALDGAYRICYRIMGADGKERTAEAVVTVAAETEEEGEGEGGSGGEEAPGEKETP